MHGQPFERSISNQLRHLFVACQFWKKAASATITCQTKLFFKEPLILEKQIPTLKSKLPPSMAPSQITPLLVLACGKILKVTTLSHECILGHVRAVSRDGMWRRAWLCDPALFCVLLILKLWMNTVFLNVCLQIILLRYIFNMLPSELGDRRNFSKCALVKSRKTYKFSWSCCDYGERR